MTNPIDASADQAADQDSAPAVGGCEPGPDDLRWAEDMFAKWERRLAELSPAALSGWR